MANFKEIAVVENTENLIKKSAKIHVRRYVPVGRYGRYTVVLSNGWPMDMDEMVVASCRDHAKEIVKNFLRSSVIG